MDIKNITKAIFNLAPNAEFAFIEDDLSTLEWHTPEITQPTNAAILAEAQRIAALPISEPTVAEKLASVGLSVEELKAALS